MMENSRQMRKQMLLVPRPLQAGDTVAVVAASGPADPALLVTGVEWLESRGFRVVAGPNVRNRNGYLAGTDDERVVDLNSMLADSRVRGIFAARGGYGSMRILESLETELVRRDPKIIVGMSDITALQLYLFSQCGLVTFSGPMVAGQMAQGLDSLSVESLLQTVTVPLDGKELIPGSFVESMRVVRPGNSSGILIGGCLSLVTALLGTPYCPDFSGAILFLEEVNEPPYRIDRMLTQLRLAGVFEQIRGVVTGHFLGPQGGDIQQEAERIIVEITESSHCPVIAGLPHGHTLPNLTLPHGIPVTMDTRKKSLKVSPSPMHTV
jgi:muramoyltetrapeptide carboxypeptidase